MAKSKLTKSTALINFLGLVAILVLINILSYFFVKRVDLTEDKRYSLSDYTIEMLKDDNRLKDRVFFKIYLEGDLPADMKNIRNEIQNTLDEFVAVAGDKIQYEFIDPDGSDDEDFNDQVKQNIFNKGEGILPTYLKNVNSNSAKLQTIWPGAIVEYRGVTADVVQFFDRESIVMDENVRELVDQTINNIEFKLISSIRRVTTEKKKRIGFLQGHGELDKKMTWDIRQALEKDYVVGDIEINGQLNAFEDIDALVIAKPTQPFNEKDKFIIDQFIMNGGKTLWFIDPIDVNLDSLAYTGETMGLSRDLNIEKDFLFKYGVRINNDIVVDNQCTNELVPPNDLRPPGLPWVFYPLIYPEEHPICINIDPIHTQYASSLTVVNEKDTAVKKTVLLRSSVESKALLAPVRINFGFAFDQWKPDFSNPEFGSNPVAVLLEGNFKSPFENRISDAFINDGSYKAKFKSVETKMLVVSDGDMVNSSYVYFKNGQKKLAPIPLHVDRLGVLTNNGTPKYVFGNREFVQNAVDYLLGDNSLIGIRSKTITLRMLDAEKIEEEKSYWKFINIAFPLLFLAVLGAVFTFLRKRKYSN
ncbi:MAG: gliding motility-associated ABC transporter substrate-binding protein GldG [Putridiphycobacter sp.]